MTATDFFHAQTTSQVLMVEPRQFGFNEQTAVTNRFMIAPDKSMAPEELQARAMREFEGLVARLGEAGVDVLVIPGENTARTPDAVFPNNWLSTHEGGQLVLYPMAVPSRRAERRPEILAELARRFIVARELDLVSYEESGLYLEGTGSLVLDRANRVAYAGLSSRAHEPVLRAFCDRLGYRAVAFELRQADGSEIYHANVMMSVGRGIAVICLEAIPSASERVRVQAALIESGRRVIEITAEQMALFCGNVIELRARTGEPVWAMSSSARRGFTAAQLGMLEAEGRVVDFPIPVIERHGGGSVRCMIAEIFLAEKGSS